MRRSFLPSSTLFRLVLLASLLWLLGRRPAAGGESIITNVFTKDTLIAAGNTNYEGQAIIIQRCTVTIAGTHTFDSVRVAGTLTLVGGSTLNVAGTLAVLSRVVCWYTNTTGQVSNQLAEVSVTINASNVVVASGASFISWNEPYMPWTQPNVPWSSRYVLWRQPPTGQRSSAGSTGPVQSGARPQTFTNAAPTR
jgi:hypothetical protein